MFALIDRIVISHFMYLAYMLNQERPWRELSAQPHYDFECGIIGQFYLAAMDARM